MNENKFHSLFGLTLVACAAGSFSLQTAAAFPVLGLEGLERISAATPSPLLLLSETLTPNEDPDLATTTGFIEQKLEPHNPASTATFQQRYYLNSLYAEGEASPVFYFICGESICTPTFMKRYVGVMASHLHAHVVALEHRYFGESKPFPKFTRENIRFLTVENALDDLASAERYLVHENHLRGPWIAVGRSYAGNLAAYFRLTHPELVIGAIASSAPVELRYDFPEFDFHAATHVPENCRKAVQAVNFQVEQELGAPAYPQTSATESRLDFLKKLFHGETIRSAEDFVFYLSDFAAEAVQYGTSDELCQAIDPAHPLESYAAYATKFINDEKTAAYEFTFQTRLDSDGRELLEGSEWTYQSCRDLGYWQPAYSDPSRSMRARSIQTEQFRKLCDRLFGISDGGLTEVALNNETYYQKLLDPKLVSNIIFSNGSQDPWSELSIADFRHNHANSTFVTLMLDGGSHGSDLDAPSAKDPASFTQARMEMEKTVRGWLKL